MTDRYPDVPLNLLDKRAPGRVWDRAGWSGSRRATPWTRAIAGGGGSALVVYGLGRRTWIGRALAGLGAAIAWWAVAPADIPPAGRGWLSAFRRPPERWMADDPIHEASTE